LSFFLIIRSVINCSADAL